MPRSPLVTVIIPAYNAQQYLERTLNSLSCQTFRAWEALIVDDGSQDGTAAIAVEAAQKDPRIRLLSQANAGVAAARNRGIAEARGDFLAPLDADDLWAATKLERQVECMESAGESCVLVYSWWAGIDEHDRIEEMGAGWRAEGRLVEALVYTNFIGNASVPLFRTSAVKQVGGYNEDFRRLGGQGCEDWDLSLRLAKSGDLRLVPEYLVGYRNLRDSMSKQCGIMAKSYELVIEGLIQRTPHLSPRCLAWSAGLFYTWMSGLSYHGGDYKGALDYIGKLLKKDPAAILNLRLPKTALRSLARSSLRKSPLKSDALWFVPSQQVKRELRLQSAPYFRDLVTTHPSTEPWSPRRFHPWRILCHRRWSHLSSRSS